MLSAKEKNLLAALEPRAAREGVEIVTLEVTGSKKAPTIRVYIDTPDGVSFDELSSAQQWINAIMDEIDPFPGAYMLEVSSPGIDRPLRTPEHFARFAGDTAVVKTVSPLEGCSSFTGTIAGVVVGAGTTLLEPADAACTAEASCSVVLVLAGEGQAEPAEVRIALDNIKRAHLRGVIDFSS